MDTSSLMDVEILNKQNAEKRRQGSGLVLFLMKF